MTNGTDKTDKQAPQPIDEAFRSAALTAWFETSMERDKGLFTLSAAGIGALITLATTVGIRGADQLVLYIFTLLSFVACLLIVLWIFQANRKHLEDLMDPDKAPKSSPLLEKLDAAALILFGIAILLSCVIGIGTGIESYSANTREETKVADKISDKQLGNDSFNNASVIKKSYNGAEKLVISTPLSQQTQRPVDQQSSQQQSSSGGQSSQPADQSKK